MRQDLLCGLSFWHPKWLQKFANTKTFLIAYGLLGTVQAMSYMYFVVTLTTIEKRFKIPSQTTGIILSGNEISQILLALILSYAGGQRNRPRWIAWGLICCSLSCFILTLPHFIYGGGEDSLQLTQEFLANLNNSSLINFGLNTQSTHHLCYGSEEQKECNQLVTIVPLVLIFLSQFVLGIGNSLYYSLGQTYIDDNTKKTNTPLMLACAMALRLIGPIGGFFLGFMCLNMFIDPRKTPVINNKDPRWLGAWWFGWIILGSIMLLFSGIIGLFPKKLPKKTRRQFHAEMPRSLQREGLVSENIHNSNLALNQATVSSTVNFPQLRDFPRALMRLLKNKLLMFNITAAIFYILGAAGYMTFLTKYMEVQFQRSAQNATILVGPLTIVGMVLGLLFSGFIISKKKPSPNKVLFWNVVVGFLTVLGQFSYFFHYCNDTQSMMKNGMLNIMQSCNANCSCEGVPYTPVCHVSSQTTYFSPCHAACSEWNDKEKHYSNCSCIQTQKDYVTSTESLPFEITSITTNTETDQIKLENTERKILTNNDENNFWTISPGACIKDCAWAFYMFSLISMAINMLGSSGRVGNILVNYRAVSAEDKSFAQGLALMLVSLFALIPGPIVFGWIIDQTCLVWTEQCQTRGHCQLYDQKDFRYYVNAAAIVLTSIGVFFDVLVWYFGKELDLYGEKEQQKLKEIQRKNRAITPLLTNK